MKVVSPLTSLTLETDTRVRTHILPPKSSCQNSKVAVYKLVCLCYSKSGITLGSRVSRGRDKWLMLALLIAVTGILFLRCSS